MAAREGTVFISEDIAEPCWFAATFSASWQHGHRHRDGPVGVSADEAIAWGREQADRVLIRLADSDYYSAGSKPAGDREPWPEGRVVEPRRQPGMEHLDLVTGEPIAWEARLSRWISRERTEADVARLRAALEADPDASRVRAEVKRGRRVKAILRFVVQARSHAEALEAVMEVERRAVETAPYPADETPESGPFVVHGLDPMNDIRPAGG